MSEISGARPYLGDTTRSPIVATAIGAIVAAFLAIGIIASYLPATPAAGWPVGFLVLSAILTIASVALLARRRSFAWPLFFKVARWMLVMTGVFAVMAVYVFVSDGTPASTLAVMACVLVLAAINVPLLVGFSVARHERAVEAGQKPP